MKTSSKQSKKHPAPDSKRRVFIVDDHPFLREGLKEFVNQQADFTVCGEAGSVSEALEKIGPAKPDVAMVDLSLDGSSGLDLIKDLAVRFARLPVLVLSMHDESLYAERSLRAGALGYVMKREPMSTVLLALRRVATGQCYVSDKMAGKLIHQSLGRPAAAPTATPEELLSDRELEVFELIGQGHRRSTIADALHISAKTVETHTERIKEKLHLATADDLRQHATSWVQPISNARTSR